MIQRIFHPIGQGAFYSERHDDLNFVYDCGNWRNTRLSDKVVIQSFTNKDIIDILFISHFDYDHVSKISRLKNHVNKIKRVIMPLLHDEEKILLTNIYRALGLNITRLIINPQQYFGEETSIIYVEPTPDNESSMVEITDPQSIDDITKKDNENNLKIESRSVFTLYGLKDWLFIPYNYEYTNRNKILISELNRGGFDVARLKSDPNYTLEKIIEDVGLTIKQAERKLKSIYDSLKGKINQNSMMLYSGPPSVNIKERRILSGMWDFHFPNRLSPIYHHSDRAACIYTGDADLNQTSVSQIFRNYLKNVGTIQIPHHGDIKSLKSQDLNDGHYYCPISVGLNNTYGHPSSRVIAEILSRHSNPILITEKLDSTFIEIIN